MLLTISSTGIETLLKSSPVSIPLSSFIKDSFDSIKVCTQYKFGDSISNDYSNFMHNLDSVSPIYETMNGWNSNIENAKIFTDLPENAQKYVEAIQSMIETKISVISTGPERSQTIDKDNYLNSI